MDQFRHQGRVGTPSFERALAHCHEFLRCRGAVEDVKALSYEDLCDRMDDALGTRLSRCSDIEINVAVWVDAMDRLPHSVKSRAQVEQA